MSHEPIVAGSVRNIVATIECGGCGKQFTVELTTESKRPPDWNVFDDAVDAVRGGFQQEDHGRGMCSVQGGHLLCASCTHIVDNDPSIPENRSANSPEEVRFALDATSQPKDTKEEDDE